MFKTVLSLRGSAPPFRKSRLAVAIAAASGITAMPPVFAQEPAGASPAIEEVIVTARKREANIQDTPASIQVFTADDLDRPDIDRFEDFADQSPSISYVSAGPGTQLMHIRGVSDGGIPHVFRTKAATMSYYLDEQPVNGRSGGPPDFHLYDVERIEVLRGPGGTYYGASSVSGTVRIITNKPDPEAVSYGVDLTGGSIATGTPPTQPKGSSTCRFPNVPRSAGCFGTTSRTALSTTCS